jgi:Gpi18-like mannosyltransferase
VDVVKLVPNLFDLATGAVIFFFVRKQLSFKLSLLATAFYIFNPAVIYNAAVWGQFDAIYTFFLVLSLILALKSKPEFSAVSLSIAILTKPQAIALLPLIAFLIFKKNGLKRFLYSTGAFIATIFVVILPMEWSNPVTFLSNIYFGAYSGYEYMSVNAFNLWGLFGLWVSDGSYYILGWILFGAFTAFGLFVLNKRWGKTNELFAVFVAFALLFAFFMLPTRIHERYLFPAISVLALMFPFVKRSRLFYIVITSTFLANISYVLYGLNNGFFVYSDNLIAIVVSAVNLIMFLYTTLLMWDELKGRSWFKVDPLKIDQKDNGKSGGIIVEA